MEVLNKLMDIILTIGSLILLLGFLILIDPGEDTDNTKDTK